MNKQQKNLLVSMLLIAFFIVIILFGLYFYIQKNNPSLLSNTNNSSQLTIEEMLAQKRAEAINPAEIIASNDEIPRTDSNPPLESKPTTEHQAEEHHNYAKVVKNLGYQKNSEGNYYAFDLETDSGILSFYLESLDGVSQALLDFIKPGECLLLTTPQDLSHYQWHHFTTFHDPSEYMIIKTTCPE